MITASDLLAEAGGLMQGTEVPEVRRRTVISRAYYAAFHHALPLAEQHGYVFSPAGGSGRHEHLFRWMRASPERPFREAAETLKHLKSLRVRADYRIAGEIGAREMTKAVTDARVLIARLRLPERPQ